TVGADQRVDDPELFVWFDEHRARGVAEQHASGAIGVIDDCRHLVGADDDDFPRLSGLDELRGHGERIDEAGACGLYVEAADRSDTAHLADQIGGRTETEIPRGGPTN